MEWNRENVMRLQKCFVEKHMEMRSRLKTDKANLSSFWNKYLAGYNAKVIRNTSKKGYSALGSTYVLETLIRTINFNNEDVASSLIIQNPDRPGQYILISRDVAERALVLGMI